MREVDDGIALLQLRSEQLLIHLEQVPPNSPDAVAARKDIDGMTQRLLSAQRDRDRLRMQGRSTPSSQLTPIRKDDVPIGAVKNAHWGRLDLRGCRGRRSTLVRPLFSSPRGVESKESNDASKRRSMRCRRP